MQDSFSKLLAINVRDKVEKKNGMDYLSWAYAWQVLKQNYPSAQRIVYEHEHTGLNYFTDGKTGYVKVGVAIGDLEHIDYLPIMDHRNRAIPIDNITSFDVNKTIQRSTVKAIAMHGLGIQLWTGEDLPEVDSKDVVVEKPAAPARINLKVDDENWAKVAAYVTSNKAMPIATIIEQLSRKYKISAPTQKAINELHSA